MLYLGCGCRDGKPTQDGYTVDGGMAANRVPNASSPLSSLGVGLGVLDEERVEHKLRVHWNVEGETVLSNHPLTNKPPTFPLTISWLQWTYRWTSGWDRLPDADGPKSSVVYRGTSTVQHASPAAKLHA